MLLFHLWSYFTTQSMTAKNLVEKNQKISAGISATPVPSQLDFSSGCSENGTT